MNKLSVAEVPVEAYLRTGERSLLSHGSMREE